MAQLAANGRTNRQIAEDLFVTIKTVETHLGAIYRKLVITSRDELGQALGSNVELHAAGSLTAGP